MRWGIESHGRKRGRAAQLCAGFCYIPEWLSIGIIPKKCLKLVGSQPATGSRGGGPPNSVVDFRL